jgi:hypothetical protein
MSTGFVPVPFDENSGYNIKCTIDDTKYIQHIALVNSSLEIVDPATDTRSNYSNTAITVTDTEVELTTGLSNKKTIIIYNMDSDNTIYIGKTGVSDSTGFPIKPDSDRAFDCSADMFAICSSGETADVRIIELN